MAYELRGVPRPRDRIGRGRPRLQAVLLLLPVVLFMMVMFVLPVGLMLSGSVVDGAFSKALPETALALRQWDGEGLPPETTARIFVREVQSARGSNLLAGAAHRLNADTGTFRSLLLKTARGTLPPTDDALAALRVLDARWGQRSSWAVMQRAAGPLTPNFLLATLDLRRDDDGFVVPVPEERALFRSVLLRTISISVVVSASCLFLGYPVAYLLANLPTRSSNLLLILVLVPFWTSVLVRTTAWLVLLQKEGLVNNFLLHLGVITSPLTLIYNRFSVYVAMVHVLLPLMILPLYSIMRGIGPAPMRAAMSLGAHPLTAFRRVYLPQTRSGIAAGLLLVFISAAGYYVTPELLGGGGDQMVSYFIAYYTNRTTNFGLAAALSIVLLIATGVVYFFYVRLEAQQRLRNG